MSVARTFVRAVEVEANREPVSGWEAGWCFSRNATSAKCQVKLYAYTVAVNLEEN